MCIILKFECSQYRKKKKKNNNTATGAVEKEKLEQIKHNNKDEGSAFGHLLIDKNVAIKHDVQRQNFRGTKSQSSTYRV